MNRNITLLCFLLLLTSAVYAQTQAHDDPTHTSSYAKSNYIRSGFYLKMGPVIPVGNFAAGQTIFDPFPNIGITNFASARIGGNLGMGYLIYIAPAVANNFLRFGIDAGFFDFWFATAPLPSGSNKKPAEFWYYFIGQKFGPLITINPVDKLMIDLSFKLNANLSWHNSDWGAEILGQEVMMNIRYKVILVSFMYNFGTINYNDFDSSRPVHKIDISTIRILVGFKF